MLREKKFFKAISNPSLSLPFQGWGILVMMITISDSKMMRVIKRVTSSLSYTLDHAKSQAIKEKGGGGFKE